MLCVQNLQVKEREWLKNIDKNDNVNDDSIQTTSILSLQSVKELLEIKVGSVGDARRGTACSLRAPSGEHYYWFATFRSD